MKPTKINGIPYAEWMARKGGVVLPTPQPVEKEPVKNPLKSGSSANKYNELKEKIATLTDDLEMIYAALDFEPEAHLMDVLGKISELMALEDRTGSPSDTRLKDLSESDDALDLDIETPPITTGPEYIDIGD